MNIILNKERNGNEMITTNEKQKAPPKRPPKPKMNVIFINPNTPEEVERALHNIAMERIMKKLKK